MPGIYHRCTKCSHVDTVRDLCVACGNPTYQPGLCGECTMRLTRMAGYSAIGALLAELFDGIRACAATTLGTCEACGYVPAVVTVGGGAAASFNVCAGCAAEEYGEREAAAEYAEATLPAYTMGEDPTTCPLCGVRTTWTEGADHAQIHSCPGCKYTFAVVPK